MLLNNFFYLEKNLSEANVIHAAIRINTGHEILQGHFPGQPVVPGVCILEMLREILEITTGPKLQLVKSSMIKFLVMFAPPNHSRADFLIQYKPVFDYYEVNAQLQDADTIFFKMKGNYKKY